MEKELDREATQPQEDNNNVDWTMEIEMTNIGLKRRARVPLAELENKEDNRKQVKVDGEIKELGKLFAQHWDQRWLLCSPAIHNECHQLKL